MNRNHRLILMVTIWIVCAVVAAVSHDPGVMFFAVIGSVLVFMFGS